MASICTYTGIQFTPFTPRVEQVCAADVAHALSNMPRFAGHTRRFYSVAQHSVTVSLICAPEDAVYGLLHDASEAYLLDVPTPWKHLLPGYREAEIALQVAILEAFGLQPRLPDSVKESDQMALLHERAHLMPAADWWKYPSGVKVPSRLGQWDATVPLSPYEARAHFVTRLLELYEMGHIPCIPGGVDEFRLMRRAA